MDLRPALQSGVARVAAAFQRRGYRFPKLRMPAEDKAPPGPPDVPLGIRNFDFGWFERKYLSPQALAQYTTTELQNAGTVARLLNDLRALQRAQEQFDLEQE